MPRTTIGVPGVKVRGDAVRRDILTSEQGKLVHPGGRVLDASKTRDLTNTGDTDTILAGKLVGRITGSSKYANSVIGSLGVLHDTGATPNALTVPVAVAVELVRRDGATPTFKMTGSDAALGTVNTATIVAVSVNTTTGVIDITGSSTADDYIAGSHVTPSDGSEVIRGILLDLFGVEITDEDNTEIDNAFRLLIEGQVRTGKISDYPADASHQTSVKAAITAFGGGYIFDDDIEGG